MLLARVLLWISFFAVSHASNLQVVIPVSGFYTIRGTSIPGTGPETQVVIQWGVQDALQNDFQNQTLDVDIQFEFYDSQFTPAVGVRNLIEWALRGLTLAIGYPYSGVSLASAQAGTTYGVAQLASSASSATLSDDRLYPYFSRLSSTSVEYAASMISSILHMIDTQGEGWSRVAILTTSDEYGQSAALAFLDQAKDTPIKVAIWEAYLPDSENVSVEVEEVVHSDARVIVVFTTGDYDRVLLEAEKQGLLDDYHVFMGGVYVTGPSHIFRNGTVNEPMVERLRGHLGVAIADNSVGERYERLLHSWNAAEPTPTSPWGKGTPPVSFYELHYDLGVLTVHTVVEARRQGLLDHGKYPTAEEWTRIARSITFEGASGFVEMEPNGDRPMPMSIVNWRPEEMQWKPVGLYTPDEGVEFFSDQQIIWHDNTTNYPDLLKGPGYKYWSCTDGKEYFDETGHAVKLHTPDAGGFDDIDAQYICDHFIDCPNLSDESGDCGANYTALFIAFGIVTGLLILATCCLIPFVIVFGFIFPRRRVKASSPTFLLIIILSCLLGYISEFSWYGRPHPVACGFRPWLLGLAVVSLVSALNAKTWRLWRIFKKAYKKERISDLQLIVLYVIMVIPAVVILVLWTALATPTASVKIHSDGMEHYVCYSGGVTGETGTIVFFFVLVGYEALILLIAAVLVIATRNVPSFFNESKLIAISIYNLGFLAAVGIPVIIVLEFINPFASWVIRSVAVLYAFTATLVLQFGPKVVGVIVIDRGRNTALPSLGKTSTVRSSSSSEYSQPPTQSESGT